MFFCMLVSYEQIIFFYSRIKPLSPRQNYFYPVFSDRDNFLREDLTIVAGGAESSGLKVFIFKRARCWGRMKIWRKQVSGGAHRGNDAVPADPNE